MNPNVFRNISYGLYVLSSVNGDKPTGCTINSVMQITSDPATIAISVNHSNFTNSCIAKTGNFSISILGEDTNAGVIANFGFQSGRDVNKFADYPYTMHNNVPVLDSACGYITCKVIDTLETATHTVFLGEVLDGDVLSEAPVMTYAYYHKVLKGNSPKAAPTYLKEEITSQKEVYACSICGYVYDGGIPFKELPAEFHCPVCNHGKEFFKERK